MDNKEYFIHVAKTIAIKSKDTSTKVGCVIVDADNKIVSTGYNGFVAGCDETHMTQERPMKYELVIHAELNALLYSRRDLKNCTMYVTHAPCANCLKHTLQANIRKIFYDDSSLMKRASLDSNEAVTRLIKATCATVESVATHLSYDEEIRRYRMWQKEQVTYTIPSAVIKLPEVSR